MPSTVSVALCTYNGEKYIAEQLRSVLAQTLLPDELVLSDDGSSDRTLALVAGVFEALPPGHPALGMTRTVIVNETPLGVVRNFQQALAACTGELIALCDQDDVWHRDRVAIAVEHFAASTSRMLVHSDARLVDDLGLPLGHTLFDALGLSARERDEAAGGDELAVLLRRNLVTGATAMIRREVFEAAAPFPDASLWVHDEWLAMIATSIGEGELLDRVLVDYRQHGANQIGVRRLGLRGKIGRILEPRDGRNEYLARRAAALVEHLEALGPVVRPDALERTREKLDHLRVRATFSRHRLARVIPVLREALTGRYAHYSRGVGDILRDLLQPAGSSSGAERRATR